ncbi:hypothetical protein BOX37_23560 [Nocardia mangyaensis]|uniref:Uncharacterized protein n=1 Tax=Nocardia mangyaensis TaxID=2213200 RepID=A0A1J0VWN2_9NOCA|nr:hypothetical protein [Nocardia mangyaensis]APE36413.1 hypothetical protein BOX37_23560 [Nocardia mangyaensis]
MAGKAAKAVTEEARQRGGSLALNDEDITAFLAGVVEPGEQGVAFGRFTPDLDCPKVPRGRKVEDGFGGRSTTRKIAGAAIGVAAVASGEWFGDPRRSALHGGLDSMAGRLRIQFDPVTNGCEHILALTNTRLILLRIRGGVGRKFGPALIAWWAHRSHVVASRPRGNGGFSLAFADSSWITLHGDPDTVLRTAFPDAPSPWPGESPR